MTDLFNVFDSLPPLLSPEEQLKSAIAAAGLTAPASVVLDGKLRRFRTGAKPDKSGWYVAFGDNIPVGAFGCWRAGISQTWIAAIDRSLTDEELESCRQRVGEAVAKREAEAERDYALAAEAVREIWESAVPAPPDHPYLTHKHVSPHDARVTGDGRLVLPLFGADDAKLWGLQYITPDGTKRFHSGARVKGCLYALGEIERTDVVFIAEDFAAAATIIEATGKPCVVAYSVPNIPAVAEAVRISLPNARIVVVADNDAHGVGARYVEIAKALSSAEVVVIPTANQDANDYARAGGDLRALLLPSPPRTWSYSFAEFAKPPAPTRWPVKHWLRQQSLVLLVGPPSVGKNLLVIDWAASVVTGRDWFGFRTRQAQVFYLAGEGDYGLRARLAAWQQYHQVNSADKVWDAYGWLTETGCDLNTPGGVEKVIREIEKIKLAPELIFVDTLHRAFKENENSTEKVGSMIKACDLLIEQTGAAVVLVHHTGWNDDAQHRDPGLSALRAAADFEFLVSPIKGDNQKTYEISQTKVRDSRAVLPVYARPEVVVLDDWVGEDGDKIESAVLVQVRQEPKLSEKEQRLEP